MSLTIKLHGGLGNQMFQISACYGLALDNNDDAKFILNESNTPAHLENKPSIRYVNNIYKNIPNFDFVEGIVNSYDEPRYWTYDPIPYKPNMSLNGYFASELYFKNHKSFIKNLFSVDPSYNKFKNLDLAKSVCIHVRRGDYKMFSQIFELLDINYYNTAMDYFGKDYNFIFVSNEMNWVKENFVGDNIYYCESNDDIGDFTLMALCKHNIIANSTFSWWGAYLNKNIDNVVIRPKKWLVNVDCNFIFPTEWIGL